MALERLVYISTLTADVPPSVIDGIVAYSSAANERRGVTGMLALDEKRVCQILEGQDHVVEALFEKIKADGRHEGVVVIDRRPIEAPHFGKWGMTRRQMVDVVTLAFSI